jgi:glycosyltransferase involved in cell wall biosynthesis
MTRDLYISSFTPTLDSGRALRTYTCIRALAMLGALDLLYTSHGADEPSPQYAQISDLALHPVHPSRGLRRGVTYANARARGVPRIFARGVNPELIRAAERLAGEPNRGRVIVGDLIAAAALLPLARRRPIIYNAHNVGPTYFDPDRPSTRWSRMEFTRFERRVLRVFAESWMVSRRDLQAARDMVPDAHLRYVPNAVDVASIDPIAPNGRPGHRLLMVGDFFYPPNRTGRAFLVDEVLPLVWREAPDVELSLVGRGTADWTAPDPRVHSAGFVDDLAAMYAASDCVVVPVTTGAGTPLKFVEALAYQVPIVATPFAAKGLEVLAGKHYLQGTDAASFANAILQALRGQASGLAVEGRRIAEVEYSVQSLAERIAA